MDLTFSEPEIAFRDELRAWFAANDPGAEPEGDEDRQYAWRRDFQRRLADGGWAAVHWPREYGGRGATLTESAIFFEELGRSGAPLPANVLGSAARRADDHDLGQRPAEGALPRADPDRGGDLVPGLLRARRRLGPRQPEDARRAGRRRLGRSPVRRSGRAPRSTRSGACSSRAPTPTRPSTRGSPIS